jgi:hypothetical protein
LAAVAEEGLAIVVEWRVNQLEERS